MKIVIDTSALDSKYVKFGVVGFAILILFLLLAVAPSLIIGIPLIVLFILWVLFIVSFSLKGFIKIALEYIEYQKSSEIDDKDVYRKECRYMYYKLMGWAFLIQFGAILPFYLFGIIISIFT